LLLSLLLFFDLWELLRNMFFAESLEFSEEKAVKLRNAFSSRENPFGFSCFIICVQKKKKKRRIKKQKGNKNQPTAFRLVLLECLEGKKREKNQPSTWQSPHWTDSPSWSWALLLPECGISTARPGEKVLVSSAPVRIALGVCKC